MNKRKFTEGDLFFIKDITIGKKVLSLNNQYRVGKIIYISSYFKDMIGFIPSKNTFIDKPVTINDIEFSESVIYTGNSELKNGNWEIINNQNVTAQEVLLTKRRVGNIIMIKDQEIGICTDDDYNKYENQSVAGLGAVHYYLTQL